MRSTGYPLTSVGNNLIKTLITHGNQELMGRFLEYVSEDELNTMNVRYIFRSNGPNDFILEPILCEVIESLAKTKSHDWMLDVTSCIMLLLEKGYDINQRTINSEGNSHNITDYLKYYEFIYEGSSIYEALRDFLPEPLDPELNTLLVNTCNRTMHPPTSPQDAAYIAYQIVADRYEYLKDESKFQEFMDEVTSVYQQHNISPDWNIFSMWRSSSEEVKNFFRSIGLELNIV